MVGLLRGGGETIQELYESKVPVFEPLTYKRGPQWHLPHWMKQALPTALGMQKTPREAYCYQPRHR